MKKFKLITTIILANIIKRNIIATSDTDLNQTTSKLCKGPLAAFTVEALEFGTSNYTERVILLYGMYAQAKSYKLITGGVRTSRCGDIIIPGKLNFLDESSKPFTFAYFRFSDKHNFESAIKELHRIRARSGSSTLNNIELTDLLNELEEASIIPIIKHLSFDLTSIFYIKGKELARFLFESEEFAIDFQFKIRVQATLHSLESKIAPEVKMEAYKKEHEFEVLYFRLNILKISEIEEIIGVINSLDR